MYSDAAPTHAAACYCGLHSADDVASSPLQGNFSAVFYNGTPILSSLATFGLYGALGNELTAASAFTALALFNILRFPLNNMPNTIQRCVDIHVSMRRLSQFMTAQEAHPLPLEPPEGASTASKRSPFDGYFSGARGRSGEEPAIEIIDGEFRWPPAKPAGASTAAKATAAKANAGNGRRLWWKARAAYTLIKLQLNAAIDSH